MSFSYESFSNGVRSRFFHLPCKVDEYFIDTNVVLGGGFKKWATHGRSDFFAVLI